MCLSLHLETAQTHRNHVFARLYKHINCVQVLFAPEPERGRIVEAIYQTNNDDTSIHTVS